MWTQGGKKSTTSPLHHLGKSSNHLWIDPWLRFCKMLLMDGLVCLGCYSKLPYTWWLINTIYFSQLWKLGSLKWRCWQIQCLSVRMHFWDLQWCHLTSSTEQKKAGRRCPTPASLSYHPPHWPLPWLLVSKFQPPPHGKRVWLGRKASIMAGESKENAQAPGFLFLPLLFHPDSHHGLVCPHSGVPSPLAHPFRKTKWFSFY